MAQNLPPAFELLWGLRAPAQARGRKGLSLDAIVTAAIELADEGGLDAISMARVAERLGFTTMSLYRHVESKDELLVLMLDMGLGPPPEHDPAPAGWREGLERWAWDLLAVIQRHPWSVRVPIAGPLMGPSQFDWLERGLHALRDAALPETEKADLVLLLSGYVFSKARLFDDLDQSARDERRLAADDQQGEADAVLRSVVDPARYPWVSRAVAAGIFDDGIDRDAHFQFGLDRLLDGMERLVGTPGP
jgi:AcrR family transcriptional regulator